MPRVRPFAVALTIATIGAAGVAPTARAVSGNDTITTIAGTGKDGGYDAPELPGFFGDGGAAVQAMMTAPTGVAADARGNVYVADRANRRIRRIAPNGIITTVAGTDDYGSSGDGGPAASATLDDPYDVATDTNGNVYISDVYEYRVRRIDSSGIISNYAGQNSGHRFGGPGFGGDGGPATDALMGPQGMAVDARGNFYVADPNNCRIRRVTPDGIIKTFAGIGCTGTLVGDGGPATSAVLWDARSVAVDRHGNLYICETGSGRIRKVTANGIITTIAGNGHRGFSGDGHRATRARLWFPEGVAVDRADNVYIADNANYRIRKVTPNGIITTIAGHSEDDTYKRHNLGGDGGPARRSRLSAPGAVAVDARGDLLIADYGNYRIRKIINRSPRARFVARGRAGTKTVSFNARRSRDPDGRLIAYAWNFGDHHSAHGRRVQHTFAHAGRYTVTLTITDDSGMTVAASHRIRVVT